MGSRTQGVQEIHIYTYILYIYMYICIIYIYKMSSCPHKSELGDGTQGAGTLRVVLHSNSFADSLRHGHLTYL